MDAHLSKRLLESIFQTNSPLHDGAVVIVDFQIMTASCVLPLSEREDLPLHFGLRHGDAIGVTEVHDAVEVGLAAHTGAIRFAQDGKVNINSSHDELDEHVIVTLIHTIHPNVTT